MKLMRPISLVLLCIAFVPSLALSQDPIFKAREPEGETRDGKKHGFWKSWGENGNLRSEVFFVEGKPNGKAIYYYEDTSKKEEGEWINGKFCVGVKWDQKGKRISLTSKESYNFWKEKAEAGDSTGMNQLGSYFENGRPEVDLKKDISKALYWYNKAADKGSKAALYKLQLLYFNGIVVKQNNDLGLKYLKKAAEQGHSFSQCKIGILYEKGRFPKTNDVKILLQNLGGNGFDAANYKFGDEWHPVDKIIAVKWYLKAANQGDSGACDRLSDMYRNGIGVPKDIVEAYKWKNLMYIHDSSFIFADDSRKETSLKMKKLRLDLMERDMTPSQIALGQRLSTEFKPKRYKKPSSDNSNDDGSLSPDAFGSGFYVTSNGYLLTNQHVVDGARQVFVYSGSRQLPARVVKTDAANDLALLKVSGTFAALPVSSSRRVKLGQTVSTVGFPNPDLQGKSPKLTKGEISSLSGASDDPKYFQISVPLQPGNSGGPLVDAYGNVIGVVTAKLNAGAALAKTGDLPENVNYAVKGTFVMGFLESVPEVAAEMLDPKPRRSREFTEVVSEAEKASVMILVYE
jgi:uncharacterized protein